MPLGLKKTTILWFAARHKKPILLYVAFCLKPQRYFFPRKKVEVLAANANWETSSPKKSSNVFKSTHSNENVTEAKSKPAICHICYLKMDGYYCSWWCHLGCTSAMQRGTCRLRFFTSASEVVVEAHYLVLQNRTDKAFRFVGSNDVGSGHGKGPNGM